MNMVKALKGGIVGACVGAAVWVALDMVLGGTNAWMALVVGVLTGLAVHKTCDSEYVQPTQGVVACLCALAAIVGARYFSVSTQMRSAKSELTRFEPDEESMLACLASRLSGEIERGGQSSERLAMEGEYPTKSQFAPPVWRVAEEMWAGMGDHERLTCQVDARRQHAVTNGLPVELVEGDVSTAIMNQFPKSFGLLDYVMIPLGLLGAYFLGCRKPKVKPMFDAAAALPRKKVDSVAARTLLTGKRKKEQLFGDHDVEVDGEVEAMEQIHQQAMRAAGQVADVAGPAPTAAARAVAGAAPTAAARAVAEAAESLGQITQPQ